MFRPIYDRETVLYGNEGKYTLIKKEGNIVTYVFEPWEGNQVFTKKEDLKKLSDILHVRLVWAVWEDD